MLNQYCVFVCGLAGQIEFALQSAAKRTFATVVALVGEARLLLSEAAEIGYDVV